jgi:hypothetical protein
LFTHGINESFRQESFQQFLKNSILNCVTADIILQKASLLEGGSALQIGLNFLLCDLCVTILRSSPLSTHFFGPSTSVTLRLALREDLNIHLDICSASILWKLDAPRGSTALLQTPGVVTRLYPSGQVSLSFLLPLFAMKAFTMHERSLGFLHTSPFSLIACVQHLSPSSGDRFSQPLPPHFPHFASQQ